MTIVEKIKTSLATAKELALLSGISYNKIYNWVGGKSSPKGSDIERLESVFTNIGKLTKDEIRILVNETQRGSNKRIENALKIATGNASIRVEDLGDEIENDSDKNKNHAADNESLVNGKEKTTFGTSAGSGLNDQNMIYEMMGLMKNQNANVDKIAGALDKLANANESMARSIEQLIARGTTEEMGKRKAS